MDAGYACVGLRVFAPPPTMAFRHREGVEKTHVTRMRYRPCMLRVLVVAGFVLPFQGASLSSADIQRVVQQNAPALKQTCWGADAGATADVQLRVHMIIAPSGKVQTVSASGNDAGVSKCVEGVIAGWVFPASNAPTTVDVPFHFIRQ